MATTIRIYHAAGTVLRRLGRPDRSAGAASTGLVTANVEATV